MNSIRTGFILCRRPNSPRSSHHISDSFEKCAISSSFTLDCPADWLACNDEECSLALTRRPHRFGRERIGGRPGRTSGILRCGWRDIITKRDEVRISEWAEEKRDRTWGLRTNVAVRARNASTRRQWAGSLRAVPPHLDHQGCWSA